MQEEPSARHNLQGYTKQNKAAARKIRDNQCNSGRYRCSNPAAKVEAAEAGACGGKGGDTAAVGACGGRPPGEQECAAASGGGTAGLNGSTCRTTTTESQDKQKWRLGLQLEVPREQRAAVANEWGGAALSATLCRPPFNRSHPPYTSLLPLPPHSNKRCSAERKREGRDMPLVDHTRHPHISPPPTAEAAREKGERGGGGAALLLPALALNVAQV
ncbi:unnamed protein product [Closterium sp. NIES-53]